MQIEMLLPERRMVGLDDLREVLSRGTAAKPFDKPQVQAAADLSRRIFRDSEARSYPELLTLAYWMRKAEITQLSDQFLSLQSDRRVLTSRGLVFHLPPRNVDTMFVYSWLLAALTGNRNVIRLSPQRSDSTNLLLRLLVETLADAEEPARSSTTIVSYGHEKEPTEVLSSLCDVRVIWGGDRTVELIRQSPLAPHAKDVTFPDRYSLSAIRADAYTVLAEEKKEFLAEQFFNDSFWFDQLGCSSPRLVVWCGSQEQSVAASADFFSRVARCVERRQYTVPAAAAMQKLMYSCSAVLDFPVRACRRYGGVTIISLEGLTCFPRNHPGGGLFLEARLDSLVQLAQFLTRRDQTLTWSGFSPAELHGLVCQLNGRAIDRIVPIGQALQFHRFWDGYDLLQEFCRCVYIESAFQDARPS
jgi:hypothetical protein